MSSEGELPVSGVENKKDLVDLLTDFLIKTEGIKTLTPMRQYCLECCRYYAAVLKLYITKDGKYP